LARIRTIKPQFWTDEKIGKLPLGARLLFIGLWNLADDEGIVLWNASYFKGQIFPYDTRIRMSDINRWMGDITSLKLVACYVDVQRNTYGFVSTWHKHQVINRPQQTEHKDILAMINGSDSLNNHGTFTDNSLTEEEGKGKGREWNGRGRESEGFTAIAKLAENGQQKIQQFTHPIKKEIEKGQSPKLAAVVKVFEDCGGVVASRGIADQLADAEQEYGAEIVIAAFKRASGGGHAGVGIINYCRPIFEEYKAKGIPSNHSTVVDVKKSSNPVKGVIIES
jgi:hypothetical protein